jgi:hypothetical protein
MMWPIKTSVYPAQISMPAMAIIRASRKPLCEGEGGDGFVLQIHQRGSERHVPREKAQPSMRTYPAQHLLDVS